MSKRVKINFETINKDKYEKIPWKKIHETNKRIKEAMRKFISLIQQKIKPNL
jgi:hypothetical protein